MAITTGQVAVSTTAVELTARPATDERSSIVVTPTVDLFVGPSGVTAATGYRVPVGTSLALDLESSERLYGITASGTGTAYVLRSGV
jgi:hypothetical protein